MSESIKPSHEGESPGERINKREPDKPVVGVKRSRSYFGSIGLGGFLIRTHKTLSSQPGYEGISLEFGVTELGTEPGTGNAPYAEFRWAHTCNSQAEIGFAVVVLAHPPRNNLVVSGEPLSILSANAKSEVKKAIIASLKKPQIGVFRMYPQKETPQGS